MDSRLFNQQKTPRLVMVEAFLGLLVFCLGGLFLVVLILVWWDNDLREIVVPNCFLFLST